MTDRTISWYDEHAKGLSLRYNQADTEPLHALLRKWIPSGSSVLEIGCGSGRDAVFLASQGCRVTATDGSDAMLQAARQNLPKGAERNVSFLPALFPLTEDHPLLKHTFDAITAIAVLMHIPDSELFSFACQVKALLKEKGIFFCSFFPASGKKKMIVFLKTGRRKKCSISSKDRGFGFWQRKQRRMALDGISSGRPWCFPSKRKRWPACFEIIAAVVRKAARKTALNQSSSILLWPSGQHPMMQSWNMGMSSSKTSQRRKWSPQ